LTEAKTIQIDNGKDPICQAPEGEYWKPIGKAAAPDNNRVIWDFQKESNKPTFSILLADLFPFLKMNQLPLYMMSEQVSIHLTFTPQANADASKRLVATKDDGLDNECTLVRNDCQMIADYIYYPQDMMEQYRQANSNMTFQYVDYQFVKRTVTGSEYGTGLIQNIGGAGRVVNKVFVGVQYTDLSEQNLFNNYIAEGPSITSTRTGTVTTNLKYNDNFLYPIDVTNDARHFHNVLLSEGRVPYVSRDLYRGEGQLASNSVTQPGSYEFEGYTGTSALRGKFFYTAYRMNKGERINSRGVELYDTRTNMSTGTMRAYLQVVKVASLRDGIFESSFA
jgi:hypothetical protein